MTPAKSSSTEVTIDGRQLKLSNLDKVLYPEAGFTKGQVIDYYVRVSDAILPHLRSRPLTLKRMPDGAERTLRKLTPKTGPPGEIRETVKTGDAFAGVGDYRLELRASGKTLASTTVTIAPDFTSAVVNACTPL